MKKYIKAFLPTAILMIAFMTWPIVEKNPSYSQLMVEDAGTAGAVSTGNGIQSGMSYTLIEMQEQQKMMEKIEKMVGYVKDAKMVVDLARLMADLICTTRQLQLMLKTHSGLMNYCYISAHYKFAMLDMQAAMDIMRMVMQGGLKMDQGVRIQNLGDATKFFKSAHEKIMKLYQALHVSQQRSSMQQAYNSSMYSTMAIYRF